MKKLDKFFVTCGYCYSCIDIGYINTSKGLKCPNCQTNYEN